MSDATLHLVERLRNRLRATRQRIYLSRLAHGAIVTVGVVAASLLLALLVEAYFWLPGDGRMMLLGAVVASMTASIVFYIGRPLGGLLGVTSRLSLETLANRIGTVFSSVDDRLVNLLHLAEGRGSISDDELREEAIQDLGRQVQEVPFEELASFDAARRSLRWASIPVAGLLLAVLLLPGSLSQAGSRLLSPRTAFERPAPFAWTVAPGDSTVVKGQSLTITATPQGDELPDRATLELLRDGETHAEETELRTDSTSTFRYERASVRESIRYRIQSGRVTSPWYSVRVVNRPMVRQLQLSLEPPAYSGLPERSLAPNVGDISALPGTRVSVTVMTDSNQLAEAHLSFDNGDSTALAVEDTQATGSFTVREETGYRVGLRSPIGILNDNPIHYQIETVSDEQPSIQLQAPEAVSDIEQGGEKTLQMRMTDDYGFTRLRLYYRLAESRFDEAMSEFGYIELPLQNPDQLDQVLEYSWQIAANTDLDPVRGDVIEYYVQVWDNNSVAGFQIDKSATQVLRFPSLAQEYQDLNQEQQSAASSLEALQQEAESMRREFQSLQDDIRRKQEGSWDNQRSVEKLQERQEVMEQQAEQLSRQVESMTQEMQDKNLVSEETLQMYDDLQKVVEEINSPELQKALEKLQEAMQNMDMQSMQEALQDFEFNEQEYQQRLQRTLELFEKLRTQQQLDEVARRTSELAEQERKLAEQTEKLAEQNEDSQASEQGDSSTDAPQDETSEDSSQQNGQQSGEETSQETDASSSERSPEDSSGQQESDQNTGRNVNEEPQQQSGSSESPADSSSNNSPGERLAQEQDRSREEMEAIQERMEELRNQMEEIQQSPKEQFDRVQQQMQRDNLPQKMQENSQQLRNQQFNEAQQGQQSMQQQLQQLSEQMNQMQQSMRSQQMQVNIAGIRQALEDVLHLSTEQENLRRQVDEVASDSPILREVSQQQVSLSEGLSVVNDSLQQLAQDIPRMSRRVQQRSGEALRAMSESVATITAREMGETASHQKTAMEHLNNLALDLSQLLEQLQNMQQSGSGNMSMQQMMQQLQQMAGQQEKLNQQIQQMLNDMQGNRLSQDQQERLQQMRQQQAQIRKQLEEVRRSSDAENELLGDLEKVAEQMEESIRELRERSVSREMVERQQQILTRLLQAQKSLQTQGKEERRTGETGEDVARESPERLSPAEQAEQLRKDLLRALESGYAPDYEELIKQYFKVLQEQQ